MKPIEVIEEGGFHFAVGFLDGVVCTKLSIPEIECFLARHPSGTKAGWVMTDEEPIPCPDRPEALHYHVEC